MYFFLFVIVMLLLLFVVWSWFFLDMLKRIKCLLFFIFILWEGNELVLFWLGYIFCVKICVLFCMCSFFFVYCFVVFCCFKYVFLLSIVLLFVEFLDIVKGLLDFDFSFLECKKFVLFCVKCIILFGIFVYFEIGVFFIRGIFVIFFCFRFVFFLIICCLLLVEEWDKFECFFGFKFSCLMEDNLFVLLYWEFIEFFLIFFCFTFIVLLSIDFFFFFLWFDKFKGILVINLCFFVWLILIGLYLVFFINNWFKFWFFI